METVEARRARVEIWYNDKDISADVRDMLVSFDYTDFASGLVNDLQVSFRDPDGRWRGSWYPDRGARLRARIVQTDEAGARAVSCGKFVIDTPTYNGPPGVITLKATSASIKTSLRREKKSRRWQDTTLKGLVEKIAGEHGVEIKFKGADAGPIAKADQKDMSDLEFLLKHCQAEGYALKVAEASLVVYPRAQFDGAAPVAKISATDGTVMSYCFSEDNLEAYRACKCVYYHPDKKMLSAIYEDPDGADDGPVYRVRRHLGSHSEALRVAKATLALVNRNRRSCEMTRTGDVRLHAGVTVDLVGWGVMDGRYAVDEVRHAVGGGYTNTLKMARVV